MPVLKNKKHEAFARAIGIKGMSATAAYREVWPDSSQRTAEVEGSKLSLKPEISLRIDEFREEAAKRAAEKDFLTVEEKRAFLARVVRTPIAQVNKDSDLCQEWAENVGQFSSSEKIKMPSKLEAIRMDNDLAVEGAEAGANKALEIIIRKL